MGGKVLYVSGVRPSLIFSVCLDCLFDYFTNKGGVYIIVNKVYTKD